MSLRDRIAKTLYDVALNWSDELRHEWGDLNEDLREAWRRDADSILSDPEIAALREVAEKAKAYRSVSVPLMVAGYAAEPCGVEEDKELFAAIARLEEARRG